MPSLSERRRNNVRAGIFVTAAIILAVGTIIALTDIGETLFQPRDAYTVVFPVADGVKNLKKGAEVRVGGVLMGKVTAVRPRVEDGAFEVIDVEFRIGRDVKLYEGAQVIIASALIGADAWLEIYSVGDPARGLPAGGRLQGASAPGGLAALLGPDNANKASRMIDDLVVSTGNVREVSDQIARKDWPAWSDRIHKIMDWASGATGKIDAVLDEGQGFLADGRGLVNENRPGIREIVTNVQGTSEDLQAVMQRVRAETIEKVHRLLETGQRGLDRAVEVLQALRDDYDVWGTDITETLAAARLTAQQLKLAGIEVRRSPWKLLYRPTRTELEHELLYEAARSFALAGSDLKATSDSARRILDRHGPDLAPETLRELDDLIHNSLKRYKSAQEQLVKALIAD